MADLKDTVAKMTKALVDTNGYAYATGYLSSYLAQIIEKHVDPSDRAMIEIEMLSVGINAMLDDRNAKAA